MKHPGSAASGTGAASESTPLSLSPHERTQLRRGDLTRLPLVFVIASLALAVILPSLAQIRITRLRDEVNQILAPAQGRVFDILLEVAVEGAAQRGYVLTGDEELASEIQISRAQRLAAQRQLDSVLSQLEHLGAAELITRAESLQTTVHELDSLVAATSPRQSAASLKAQHDQFTRLQSIAGTLSGALTRAIQEREREIMLTGRAVAALTALLVLLALSAGFLVYRLGKRFRALALRLDESDARFRQIAENLTSVIWLSDPALERPLYVNRAFERLIGRPRETLYADPDTVWAAIHPDDRHRVREAVAESRTHPVEITLRLTRPDGDLRWLGSRSFPVRDEAGRVFRIAGIVDDITEARVRSMERERLLDSERQAREAAEQRKVELERVTESRNRLLRGFTHDVKNPLGAADGHLALLEEGIGGPVPAHVSKTLSTVRRLIGQGLELVRQLLDLARAEAGELELSIDDVDLELLLNDLTETFRPQADAKHLDLRLELPKRLPRVCSDGSRIRQIAGNLVSNAVKYTPPGGRITVSADDRHGDDPESDDIAIVVSDTGPGIPPDNLPKLFAEFTRFDPHAAEGAGIGLAISQRMAHALGGEITVESELGRGTTFALRLPLAIDGSHSAPRERPTHTK